MNLYQKPQISPDPGTKKGTGVHDAGSREYVCVKSVHDGIEPLYK